ncbi:MAG: ATP-dependent Clp protease ATP-binding subunit [Clostridia bacterium]|nr:ATP-dependent Clp protease ATP-binding subunit [Clostridia bacterium]
MNPVYTQLVQTIIEKAKEHAKEIGSSFVGTEDILYSMCENKTGVAYKILNDFGIKVEILEKYFTKADDKETSEAFISPKLEEVFNNAIESAKELKIEKIGSELLLFAIINQDNNLANNILKKEIKNYDDFFSAVGKSITSVENNDNEEGLSFLTQFGRNLNELAQNGKIENVIGRDEEIQRVINILSRKQKNNPCIVGEAGVGKSAIVEYLAKKIVENDVPDFMKDKIIIALDVSMIVAGSKYRGEFEDRLKNIFKEALDNPNIILFIDELHTIVGAGSSEGSLDAANILKPSLARGDIQIIGATTIDEYTKYIEKDQALERRFQKVIVEEPSEEETFLILKGIKSNYEKFHNISISDSIIKSIVSYSKRYIWDRYFPDKAIDVLDEACAFAKSKQSNSENLKDDSTKREEAIKSGNVKLAIKLENEKKDASNKKDDKKTVLELEDVKKTISLMTNIPISNLFDKDYDDLNNLEKCLSSKIIGQDEAIKEISMTIKKSSLGIGNQSRPIGSFMFLGPTGCGKTYLSTEIAKALYGTKDAIIKIDMSEYMEKHTVSKLIGAPPGYVGFEDGGFLTDRVRKRPYSVIVFDEIEKAHPDVFNILLQILDEGILTDSKGRKINFRNSIIILTSNVGAKDISQAKSLGFGSVNGESNNKKDFLSIAKKQFNPEFLNRLDGIIVFNKLTMEDCKKIVDLEINESLERLENAGFKADVTDNFKDYILEKGYSNEYGARNIKREIANEFENEFANYILQNPKNKTQKIKIDYDKQKKLKKFSACKS